MITQQFPVEFRKDGTVSDPNQVNALLAGLTGASDLLVLVHGWDNDKESANGFYTAFLNSFSGLPQPDTGPGSRIVVLRAFWPSRRFDDQDLIPGGGAASATTENDTALLGALAELRRDPDLLGSPEVDPARASTIDEAVALVDQLEHSETARKEYVLRIRAVLTPGEAAEDDASQQFFDLEPEELFDLFDDPVPVEPALGGGGAAALAGAALGGSAGFLGDLLSGPKAAARRIANYATYYQMKTRAGTVGRGGLAATVTRVRDRAPQLPVHLVGHSFGGRAVTAAASALAPGGAPVTMSLLQAAFSHNGLAQRFDGKHDGAFRNVLRDHRISGPIVITCTKNDQAVGIAYPLASKIARDDAAGLGDRNDPYGGMGRNGAQHTPEVSDDETEVRAAGPYTFAAGSVYNLNADRTIHGHSDVRSPAVANVVQHVVLRQ